MIAAAAGDRRGGDPPRLRLPVRERRVRRAPARRPGIVFVGPPADGDRGDGRQDPRQADGGRGRRAGRARARDGAGLTDAELARRRRRRSATRCWSSRRPAAAARACGVVARRRRAAERARRRPAARRAAAFGDDTLLVERFVDAARATSRSRCWPTPTATSCTSASASAACSAGTRRSSRRRRRRCSTAGAAGGDGRARPSRRRGPCGYAGAGTVEFIVVGRPARRVLLHGDEHPAAGRAPGHRAGHRARPRRAAAAGRRRASRCRWRRTTSRSRGHADRGPGLRRGPGARLPADRRHASCACASRPGRHVRVDSGHRRRVGGRLATTTRCSPRSSPGAPDRADGAAPPRRRAGRHRRARASTPTSAFLRALLADPDVAGRPPRHRAGRAARGRPDGLQPARPSRSRTRCSPRPPWTALLDLETAAPGRRGDVPAAGGSASPPGPPLAGRRPADRSRCASAAGPHAAEVASRRRRAACPPRRRPGR